MRTSKLSALLVSGTLLLVACGSGDSTVDIPEPTSTASVITTAATTVPSSAVTSTASTAIASTVQTTPTTQAVPDTTIALGPISPFSLAPDWAAPAANSGGAHGSGCAPGTTTLPDGTWFGFAIDIGMEAVQFDLACFFFGEAAWTEAAKVGEEANNDFFIRNENDQLRTVAIDPVTPTHWINWMGSLDLIVGSYAEWPDPAQQGGSCPDFCPVWLIVDGGVVTDLVEQYIP